MNNVARNTLAIGDNLTVLKALEKKSFSVDVIYIDPPYNTGNSFSYDDNRQSAQWLDIIKKRLSIAKNLLNESGVIFISIDDNYLYELKILCDNIFNRKNYLGTFITRQAVRSNSKQINTIHEYVLSYAKNKSATKPFKIKRTNTPTDGPVIEKLSKAIKQEFTKNGRARAEKLLTKSINTIATSNNASWIKNYHCIDENGRIFFPKDLSVPGQPNSIDIDDINLHLAPLATRKWSSPKKFRELHEKKLLHFRNGRPYSIHYLEDSIDNISSILNFYSRQGTNDLNKLGLRGLFDTPKPVALIKYLIRAATYSNNHATILDFFAGSGTTGQAVMEINHEDGCFHNFFLVQLNEQITKGTEQYQFAKEHNLPTTIDQLTLYRLNTVKKVRKYTDNITVEDYSQ